MAQQVTSARRAHSSARRYKPDGGGKENKISELREVIKTKDEQLALAARVNNQLDAENFELKQENKELRQDTARLRQENMRLVSSRGKG
jgi:predicted RNase H-like nuclease (RuvC/YqgF family)